MSMSRVLSRKTRLTDHPLPNFFHEDNKALMCLSSGSREVAGGNSSGQTHPKAGDSTPPPNRTEAKKACRTARTHNARSKITQDQGIAPAWVIQRHSSEQLPPGSLLAICGGHALVLYTLRGYTDFLPFTVGINLMGWMTIPLIVDCGLEGLTTIGTSPRVDPLHTCPLPLTFSGKGTGCNSAASLSSRVVSQVGQKPSAYSIDLHLGQCVSTALCA